MEIVRVRVGLRHRGTWLNDFAPLNIFSVVVTCEEEVERSESQVRARVTVKANVGTGLL